MKIESNIPRFVSVVAIVLGVNDLIRGFMHTIVIEYAATNIAGLDLTTAQGADLLQLMGAFGISNYLTGIMLIMLGWKIRPFALAMLGFIPLAYVIGAISIIRSSANYAPSQAAWGGAPIMQLVLLISLLTFLAGVTVTLSRAKRAEPRRQTQPI